MPAMQIKMQIKQACTAQKQVKKKLHNLRPEFLKLAAADDAAC